ncbi:MAG: hypothetical protein EBR99_02775 [Actinobacteria bacterium]|nr:hypothetical protein [Actinomycetota bacterium]
MGWRILTGYDTATYDPPWWLRWILLLAWIDCTWWRLDSRRRLNSIRDHRNRGDLLLLISCNFRIGDRRYLTVNANTGLHLLRIQIGQIFQEDIAGRVRIFTQHEPILRVFIHYKNNRFLIDGCGSCDRKPFRHGSTLLCGGERKWRAIKEDLKLLH